jgi:hypothetical protein
VLVLDTGQISTNIAVARRKTEFVNRLSQHYRQGTAALLIQLYMIPKGLLTHKLKDFWEMWQSHCWYFESTNRNYSKSMNKYFTKAW